MKNNVSMFRGIINYSISTWVNLVVGLCSVLLTTRLLCPEVYGMVTMFYTVTNVMMYFIMLGIDGALIRFYNEPPNTDSVNQVIYKSLAISTFTTIIIYGFLSLLGLEKLSNSVFGFPSRLLTGLVFLYTFCQIVFRYLNISFRMSFKTTKYNIQNVLITSLSRLLVILAASFTNGFLYIIIVLTIGIVSVLCFYLVLQINEIVPIRKDGVLDFSLSLKGYAPFFRYALFSAPTYIVTYLNLYLGQQIIISFLGTYALGIFASTGAFNQLMAAFRGGFSTFWAAFVYRNYKTEQKKIGTMHNYIIVACIIISSFMVVFRDIIYLAIGADFHESKKFFSLLLILPILNFIMESTDKGISIKNRNEIQAITHIISVITNLGLAFLLVKLYGLIGVAIANALSGLVLYCLNTYYGQKYYKTIFNIKRSIIGIMIILFILIIPVLFISSVKIFVFVLFSNIISYFIFRIEIQDIFNRSLKCMASFKH